MLEIKFFTNYSKSSQHKANFPLLEQLKNNDSSFYWNGRWKEVSYDRVNGYEQLGDRFFWEKRGSRNKGTSVQRFLRTVLSVILYLYKEKRSLGIFIMMSLLILLQAVPAKNSLPWNCYLWQNQATSIA